MSGDLIQTPQTRWIHGAYESVPRGTPIVLVSYVNNGVAQTRYSALRLPGAAGGYQVTAGKTLYLTRLIFSATTANVQWHIGSGTADAGSNQDAAPANEATEDSTAIGIANVTLILASATIYTVDTIIDIATGRYPFIRGLTQNTDYRLMAIGHEE